MISFLPMLPLHWPTVKSIYEEGMATGQATFQQCAPEWEEWDQGHLPHCRLLAVNKDEVLGWAALSAVSARKVYAGVAEVSIYIRDGGRGKGYGKSLLRELVSQSEQHGIWTLYASIFPENKGSVSIYQQNGFREIGYRERIAQLNGVWRNTVIFERRSKIVGCSS